MKEIGTLFSHNMQEVFCEENVLRRFMCEGCGEEAVVRKIIMPIGPQKGEMKELTSGCRCEDLALARETLQRRDKSKRLKRLRMFTEHSLINPHLEACTFETYHPSHPTQEIAKDAAIQFTEKFSVTNPSNLLLSGGTGIGKSHLAAASLKAIMEKGHSGIFVTVPKLLTKLKATFNKNSQQTEADILSVIVDTDILVLDDIGAELGSWQKGSWSIHKIFEILDSRAGKPTVYTTNLNGPDLRQKLGERNFSRMMYHTQILEMRGTDYRIPRAK